jgi:hypothetical protein
VITHSWTFSTRRIFLLRQAVRCRHLWVHPGNKQSRFLFGLKVFLLWYCRSWYASGFADLSASAFGGANLMSQVCFRGVVELVSFKLGAYSAPRLCAVRVLDMGTGTMLFSSLAQSVPSTTALSFTSSGAPWSSNTGICLQLGPVRREG